MPRLVLCCSLFLLISPLVSVAMGRTYHVSPDGAADASGDKGHPLRTVQQAASKMGPGDVCVVHAGNYRETVRPVRSGEPDKPIRFVAARGEAVIISGTEVVEGWERRADGVVLATVGHRVDQVLVNGRLQTLARFPNASDDPWKLQTIRLEGDALSVNAAALKQPAGAWKGATLWAMGSRGWVAGTATVASSRPERLTLESKVPFWSKGKATGYVEGVAAAFDQPGEWVQQEDKLMLRLPDSVDSAPPTIEVTRRRWAFDLSDRSHIEISGIGFVAASVNMDGATYCLVDGCRFRLASFRRDIRGGFNRDKGMSIESGGLGVVLGGANNTIRDSVVAYCVGDGVSVYGKDNRVENCVVHDCNLSASDCAPIDVTGHGHVVTGCTVFNAGRSGILHRKLAAGRIEHNHIHHVGLMTNDLGGTYAFTTKGGGTVIAWNRIHDVRCHTGVGIYIDNICDDHLIHHNLVHDCQNSGIRINTPAKNILVYHNTLTRNGNAMAYWGRNNRDQTGVKVVNNIFTEAMSLGEGATAQHNYQGDAPGFVDPKSGDFRLTDGSPAVDKGTVVDGVTGQFTGDAPDLGCYERGAEPWPTGSTLPRKQWDETGW